VIAATMRIAELQWDRVPAMHRPCRELGHSAELGRPRINQDSPAAAPQVQQQTLKPFNVCGQNRYLPSLAQAR